MSPDKVPANRATWKRLSSAARWRRANAVVDQSELLPIVEHTLHATTGRPREFTARALMVCLLMHAFNGDSMVLTEAVETASHLTPSQRRELGLNDVTYPMLWEAFRNVAKAFANGGLPIPGTGEALTAQVFADRLIAASLPPTFIPPSSSYAIDGTDYETPARRRSWANKKSISTAGTEIPEGTVLAPDKPHNEDGWPKVGADNEPQNSMDLNARDGFRTGHNGKPGDVYVGYELHLATPIRAVGGGDVPHVVTAMTLTPAGTYRGLAGVRTVDALLATGREVTEICADRGYTYCVPKAFVLPLWRRGVDVWADFHRNQRGDHPGPIPGTLWIDGNVYSQCIPEVMKKIAPPPLFSKPEETAAARAAFDRRQAYAFTALSKRDTDGYQRLKGPALAGHVRCPNVPKSMRLSYDHPTTTCVKGEPCACGRTVTIAPDMYPRERQTHPWGTTDWAAAYYRRTAIESTNAELKTHRSSFRRGFTRVFGTIKNTMLFAFAIAGTNVMQLRAWHAVRRIPDPWAVALRETDLGDGADIETATVRARRQARRTHTYTNIGVAPPPDDGPAEPGGIDTEVTA